MRHLILVLDEPIDGLLNNPNIGIVQEEGGVLLGLGHLKRKRLG